MSFSEGISNSGTFDAGTGGNTGQGELWGREPHEYMDKSSTTLRQYCGLGTAIDSATISCNKQAGDKKVEYLKLTMHNVVITAIQGSGSGGGNDPIMELLSLNFAGIEYDYTQQSNTGDAMGSTHFGRDIQQNTNI